MNVENLRYDTRDFGHMGHPPITADNLISPDFGRAQRLGCPDGQIGSLDQGSYSYSDSSPSLSQLEIDAANQKAADLQAQVDALKAQMTSANSVATQAQLISLQQELEATKAQLPLMSRIKPYLPYIVAGGASLIVLLALLGRKK